MERRREFGRTLRPDVIGRVSGSTSPDWLRHLLPFPTTQPARQPGPAPENHYPRSAHTRRSGNDSLQHRGCNARRPTCCRSSNPISKGFFPRIGFSSDGDGSARPASCTPTRHAIFATFLDSGNPPKHQNSGGSLLLGTTPSPTRDGTRRPDEPHRNVGKVTACNLRTTLVKQVLLLPPAASIQVVHPECNPAKPQT